MFFVYWYESIWLLERAALGVYSCRSVTNTITSHNLMTDSLSSYSLGSIPLDTSLVNKGKVGQRTN